MALRLLSKRITRQSVTKKASSPFTPRPAVPLICVRSISGKNLYTPDPNKPPPFDAAESNFTMFHMMYDKTTSKFDENTKLIVVEGAHGIGKDKFCKDLAEELSMGYVKEPCMDDLYINQYGFDFRQFDHIMPDSMKTFDEKDFSRNPLGHIKGGTDRMFYYLFLLHMRNYCHSLKHIFNTGQGIVMDGSIYSSHIYANAALRQGWIEPGTHYTIINLQKRTLPQLLKPNLIIYLDAPVDVVQKNIQDSGNEWEKNSPVWTNKRYLTDIYSEFKNTYLRKASDHSRILMYDWSEGGEAEIVVEDIENLNMDDIPRYDTQQKDWRLHNEEFAAHNRYKFANYNVLVSMEREILMGLDFYDNEHLWTNPSDVLDVADILYWTESHRYAVGFNEKLDDPPNLFDLSDYRSCVNQNLYPDVRHWAPRPTYIFDEDDDGLDYEVLKRVLKANGGRRPLNHNRELLKY